MELSAPGNFWSIFTTSVLEVYCGMTLVNLLGLLDSVTFVMRADNFSIHCQNCRSAEIPLLKHNELYELDWSMRQYY